MTKSLIHPIVFTAGTVALLGVLLSFSALVARAESAPQMTVAVHNGAHATVTSAVPGTQVHASVGIASTTSSTTPTGTLDFNLYGNLSCSGSPSVQSSVSLVSGVAESATTTLTTAGLSYNIRYNGDASTTAATSTCAALATTTPAVTSSVGGTVYNDINKNSVKDGSDTGIAGFVINLHKGSTNRSPIVASTTTDSDGVYTFGSLAFGTYYVEEIHKVGWKQTTADTKVILTESVATVNFANVVATTTTKGDDHGKNNWWKQWWKKFVKFENHHDNGNHKGKKDK